jgi:flagellar motor protein MotB
MADEIMDDDTPAEPIELSRFDMHSAWRVLLWGASAAMAVAVVAGTAFSDVGAERLQQAVAALFEPAKNTETPAQPAPPQQVAQQQPAQTVTPQQLAAIEKQTRDLTKSVRELAADRDLLKAKLASVEHNLDDITGAIKKRTAETQNTAPKEAALPPVISAPQTVAAIQSPSANPTVTAPDTPVTTAVPPPAIEPSTPLEGPIPLPPTRTAALEESTAPIRELGIDVGGAANLDGLRAHWAALKANVGPDIVGLSPSFAVRQKPAGGTDYRLVLGPLPNAATAFRVCTKLIAARINCRTGTFSVKRLTEGAAAPPPHRTEQLPPWTRESTILR